METTLVVAGSPGPFVVVTTAGVRVLVIGEIGGITGLVFPGGAGRLAGGSAGGSAAWSKNPVVRIAEKTKVEIVFIYFPVHVVASAF